MRVDHRSWHFRVYSWWLSQKHGAPPQLDLCRYVRVVFLCAPARWLFDRPWFRKAWLRRLGAVLFSLYLFAAIGYWVYNFVRDPWLLLWMLVAVVTIVVVLIVLGGFIAWRQRQLANTAHLIANFVKAKKRRVCPLIEVDR